MLRVNLKIQKKKDLKKLLKQKATLEVGYFENAVYPAMESYYSFTTGKKRMGSKEIPAAQVAMINEYGTAKIPPRPFFSTTISKKKRDWKEFLEIRLNEGVDIKKAFKELGENVMVDIGETIRGWTTPPNSPNTIKLKGFNDPLVKTGRLADDMLGARVK